MRSAFLIGATLLFTNAATAATVVLYDQDFEAPANYVNNGGDVNIFNTINDNYSGQPTGFTFAQTFTVETLNVSGSARGGGTAAFGTGWSDPQGKGGNFAVGMLSSVQNDLLGLAFDAGDFPFFNLSIDISSIDLSTFSGPFTPVDGIVPVFQFTLFDNPAGLPGIGGGTILDQATLAGTASPRDTFDWTSGLLALSTLGNTNGNVILQIDLLEGGYAAFDNLRIAVSDTEGDVGNGGVAPPQAVIPLPAAGWLLLGGLGALTLLRRRRKAG